MENFILHRKDSLILTTIEVLDELGIQELSTREIARRQGVSEATLFRHYKTKNDLLLAVLDYKSKYDSDIIASARIKKLSLRDSITYFITSFAEHYQNYLAVTAILQAYDVLASEPLLAGKIKNLFFTRWCSYAGRKYSRYRHYCHNGNSSYSCNYRWNEYKGCKGFAKVYKKHKGVGSISLIIDAAGFTKF